MGGTLDFSANLSQRSGSVTGLNPDEAVRTVLEAGVLLDQITLSSDANVSMPLLDGQDQVVGLHNAWPRILHREWLHIIRTNRLSLPQALPLVTSNVARVLGIDDHKGAPSARARTPISSSSPGTSWSTPSSRGAGSWSATVTPWCGVRSRSAASSTTCSDSRGRAAGATSPAYA